VNRRLNGIVTNNGRGEGGRGDGMAALAKSKKSDGVKRTWRAVKSSIKRQHLDIALRASPRARWMRMGGVFAPRISAAVFAAQTLFLWQTAGALNARRRAGARRN